MTDTTPLTAIRARHKAATAGHWYLQPEHGPNFVATEQRGYEHGIGDLDFGTGDQADADREFVLNAHNDITVLLVEVDRLHAERDQAHAALEQHRDQTLIEAADLLERIADEAEAKVAEYYGQASGIGPGSAELVREAARTVRSLAARASQ